LLKLLAPCGGMPELLASSIGLLELIAPCGCMPDLLAPWEVTLMGRILVTGESLSLVDFIAAPSWPWFGFPELLAPY
jgi:hypothetical protein